MSTDRPATAGEIDAQIAALVKTLQETEQRLQTLTGGRLDKVVLPTGQTFLLADAQTRLRESEEKFQQLANNINDVFWIRSPDLKVVYYVSPAFEQIWGRPVAELMANPEQWKNFVVPEDRDQVQAAFTALTGDAPSLDIEYRITRPDGEIRWVRARGFKVRDADGKTVRLNGIVTDITGRKKSEFEKDEILSVLEASLNEIYILDAETYRFDYVNECARRNLGHSLEAMRQKTPLHVNPELTQASFLELIGPLRRQEKAKLTFEAIHLRADGTTYPVEVHLQFVRRDARQVFLAVANDITERKLGEQLLRSREQEQRRLAEQLTKEKSKLVEAQAVAKVGSWETDLATLAVTWSEETYRIFGRSPDEFQPTHPGFLELVHPDDRSAVDGAFLNSLNRPGPYAIEHRIVMPDGQFKFVEERWQIFGDEAGRPFRVSGTCMDITGRKTAENLLRRSESNLAASQRIAHLGSWELDLVNVEDLAGGALRWSDEVFRIWGYAPGGIEVSYENFLAAVHPDDRGLIGDAVATALRENRSYDLIHRILRPDGTERIVHEQAEFQFDATNGRPARMIGTVLDVTDRNLVEQEIARTNRALKMLSAGNALLIHADGEQRLLEDICNMAVQIGGYGMVWVGYALEDDYKTVKPQAHAGAESGYLTEIKISWDETIPNGQGPAGQTIRNGQPMVCEDLIRNARFAVWRAAAELRGYQGNICLPLREGNRTFGLLALYSMEVVKADPGEIKLLQELADNLAFGISHLRSESEKQRIQKLVLKVATGVSASTGMEFFEQLALNMTDALEATAGFVSQLLPGQPPMGRTVAAVIHGRIVENFSYNVLDTPCQNLMGTQDDCLVPEKLAESFPRATLLMNIGAQAYVGRRLVDSNGQTVGQLFVLFDEPLKETAFITSTLQIFAARAAAELERQRSDAQVREQAALLNAASDAIILKDLDDQILFWNRGAEKLYGWTAAEAVGQKSRDLLGPETVKFDEGMEALKHNDLWLGELKKHTRDGRVLVVEARWTLVRDTGGRPKSVLAINTDITERKKMEAQFLRVQRMESIGTLAGGVAHDLNNILAPIMMSIQLLQEKVRDDDGRALLETLQASAQRGAELVKQVLTFARGVEGQRTLINVAHLIREIQKIVRETFPKNITFTFQPARDGWLVNGDPTQLHQVFMNLCVNARDAMPHGGKLSVTLENVVLDEPSARMVPGSKPGPYVLIKFADTGSGISEELMGKIFEPFFTTKETGMGTGLGLSTSQAIVKSHDGYINVYSETGKGSVFKIYLPAQTASKSAAAGEVPQSPQPRGNGELVLVVDDEEGIRLAARRTLERFGYRVMLATNGAEAVSLYARHGDDIAVVLTDMAMPVMDGPSTIIALKVMNPKVKIIGTSGHTSNEGVAKAVGAGVEHFIPKPFTSEQMLRIFAQALQEKPGQ